MEPFEAERGALYTIRYYPAKVPLIFNLSILCLVVIALLHMTFPPFYNLFAWMPSFSLGKELPAHILSPVKLPYATLLPCYCLSTFMFLVEELIAPEFGRPHLQLNAVCFRFGFLFPVGPLDNSEHELTH